jgi:pyridoxal phosphate enzyme (YggS family)
MLSLALRYEALKKVIAESCHAASRSVDDIQLIAVSKGQPLRAIYDAYRLGMRDFGENYAQELKSKIKESKDDMPDIRWHFLGAIQSNKIKIISQSYAIHSVSNIHHAEIINNCAAHKVRIFLQVNLDNAPTRHGFHKDELLHALKIVESFKHISIKGLMCIAPLKSPYKPSYWFGLLNKLREDMRRPDLLLSMGMSDDFREAIIQGSNIIRIGTLLFGSRV